MMDMYTAERCAERKPFHECVKTINAWLDKHPINIKYEANRKTMWDIERMAENLEQYGQIENPANDELEAV